LYISYTDIEENLVSVSRGDLFTSGKMYQFVMINIKDMFYEKSSKL